MKLPRGAGKPADKHQRAAQWRQLSVGRYLFSIALVGMEADEIRYALVGEMAHQVVMRGVLRQDNDAECHIYVMEKDLAAYLLAGIFTGAQECLIEGTDRTPKAPPIAAIDRKKACHIKKNFEQFKHTRTRDLMKQPIWEMTNSNGLHTKSVRAIHEHNAQA